MKAQSHESEQLRKLKGGWRKRNCDWRDLYRRTTHLLDLQQVPEEGKNIAKKENPPGAAPFLFTQSNDKKFFQELTKWAGNIHHKLGIFIAALVAELVKNEEYDGADFPSFSEQLWLIFLSIILEAQQKR